MAAINWNADVKDATITDIQNQPFSGQALLPPGAQATTNEMVVVLSNGKTLKICGVKLQDGTPRTVARLEKSTQVVDSTITT